MHPIDRRQRFAIKLFAILVLVLLANVVTSQPVVVTQPQDTSVCVESSAGFSIIAVNTTGYQWQENDGVGWYDLNPSFTYVFGETTPNLAINDANLALNAYQYRCIVYDINDDSDTSQPGVLGVYDPPIFTSDPSNQRVCKSDIAVFSVEAINGTMFQWQEYNGVGWLNIEDNAFYSGAQSPDLNVYTVTGMDGFRFHCIVKNVGCPDTSEYALLNVDPTPIVYSLTGGGEYCEGGTGLPISLSGSEMGISYNLMLDGDETGIVREGNGLSIDFGILLQEGIYTVWAYNQFTSCSTPMSGEVNVGILPLPIDIIVMGGGVICQGEVFPDIYLLSSEVGIDYSLFYNAVYTGVTSSGTGYGINFGPQEQAGYYTVIAENSITGCSRQLSGMPEIIIIELPISNAGPDHNIIQGSIANLQGNATGGSGEYGYQWSPSALVISPVTATTQTSNLYVSTIFELEVIDNQSGCLSITDTAIVYVGSGPLNLQSFTNTNNICTGESATLIAVAGGGTGNYSYLWTSSPPGFSSTLQNPVVTPNVSTTYTVTVSDGIDVVYSSVSINVLPKPAVFLLSDGGDYCLGSDGVDIELSGSETGVRYTMYYQQTAMSDILGTGNQLSFENNTQQGGYTVVAVNDNSGCSMPQNGVANIVVNELPVAEAGPNSLINAGDFATLSGSATGGTGNYTFSWTPDDLLINPSSQSPSTTPLQSTTLFNLFVTDENGCKSADDNTIVFVSGGQMNLSILTSGYPVCQGEEVQLNAMASGGSGSFTYFWQSIPIGTTSTVYNPVVYPNETTTYIVTVNDGLNILTDSVTVIINPAPKVFLISGGGIVCEGTDPSNIILHGSEVGVEYKLIRDGAYTGYSVSGDGYAIDFGAWNQNGNYTAYANNVTSLCGNEMEGDAEVNINALPISFAGQDQTIVVGASVTLTGSGSGGSGEYNYEWQPSYLCQNPTNQNTSTHPISQTTLFTLLVTDVQTSCVSLSDTSIIFTEGDELYVSATAEPDNVCFGESASMTAIAGGGTGSYTYSWTSNPSGFYSSDPITSDFPLVNTTYIIEVFDGVNYTYNSVNVVVNPMPSAFQITGGGEFCDGENGVAIGLTGSETGVTYFLFRYPDIFVDSYGGTGQSLDFGTFAQPGNYFSIAATAGNCQLQMIGEAVVKANPNPIAFAGEDQTISLGDQTILQGSGSSGTGSYNYFWNPVDSLVIPNIQQPQTTPLINTTIFDLKLTDAVSGCESNEDDVIVFVSGGPFSIQLTSSLPTICKDGESQLFALASGGSGNYSYSWTSIPAGFTSTVYNPIVAPSVTTTYHLTVSDGTDILVDQLTITVNQLPIPYSISGGGNACYGQSSSDIILSNSEINTTYTLLRNGLNTNILIDGTGFSINFGGQNTSGDYTVQAVENTSQCMNNMAGSVSVIINSLPVVDAGSDIITPKNTTTTLSGSVGGGSGSYSYSWDPVVLCQNPYYHTTLTNAIPQTTLFTFEAFDLQTQCVSELDTVLVFVTGDELSVSILSSHASICEGEQVNLQALPSGGSGNYSFIWSSNPVGFNSNLINPLVSPVESTMYYVEVFDGFDHVNDSVFVQVVPLPNIYSISGGGSYCEGNNGVQIYFDGSDPGVLYRLYRFPDLEILDIIGTGSALSFGEYTTQGDYYIIANPDNTCYSQMNGSVTVSVYSIPVGNAGENQEVELLGQTQLFGSAIGGSGNYQFSWTPYELLVNPLNQEPLTMPLNNTTLFNMSVSDTETGCVGADDQTIVYVTGSPLSLEIYSENNSICQGIQSQLYVLASGGSGSYTYSWFSNPPGFTSNVYNPVVEPDITTKYTVIVDDGLNAVVDSVIIIVHPSPIVFNLFGGGSFCESTGGVVLGLDGSQEYITYELISNNGPTGITLPGSGDSINFGIQNNEGYYWAVATENVLVCTSNMNDTIEVIELENPLALAGNDSYIEQGTSVQLSGNASGGTGFYGYNWFPDFLLIDPSIQNPTTTILDESTLYSLVVDDDNTGCISTPDSVIVYITDSEFSLNISASPNAICEGENVFLSVLPSGGSGVYSYNWYSNPEGFYSNTQFPNDTPLETITYIIEASDGDSTIIDSVIVEVFESPAIYELTGGGSYCKNGNGVVISLEGSQVGVEYTLVRNQTIEVATLIGDGTTLNFGEYNEDGSYIVFAGNVETDCYQQMAGVAVVSQYPQPIADAGPNVSISSGENATFTGSASGGTGAYDYLWSPSEKVLNPTDPDATTVSLYLTTMFSLEVIDENTSCISDLSNMIVFISGGPLNVDVIADKNQVCPGEQLVLYALPGGGNGNYSYFWESQPAGFNSTSAEATVNPNQPTWYIVTVTDGDQVAKDSMFIDTYSKPVSYKLLGGGGYCPGSGGVEIYLDNSTQSAVYTLFHNTISTGHYIIGTGSEISYGNVLTEGNYSVIAENNEGCNSIMNNVVQVSTNPLPEKFQLYGGGTYCENDPTLGILLESSQEDVEYELYKDAEATGIVKTGSGLPISFDAFAGTGNYSVVATGSETGCVVTMLGVSGLIIFDKPDITISGDNSICTGETITLSGSGGYTYEWNTEPPLYTPSITITPLETAEYILRGYNEFGCSDTASHIVEVNDVPNISVSNDEVLLELICYPDNLADYKFYMGDILMQEGDMNSWYYGDLGIISDTIRVVGSSASGCTDIIKIYLELKEAPNAFTPNGDGKNDLFLKGHNIIVYSSWGGEIYKGDSGWDGRFNGTLVSPGTYYYIHHIYNVDGEIIKTIKGSVTVVIE